MARQWILTGQEGFEKSLEFQTDIKVPLATELGPFEVLVRMHAASLNYRDIAFTEPNPFTGAPRHGLVPGCDGAGVVEAVGTSVSQFKPGDRVVTHLAPKLARKSGDEAQATFPDTVPMLGLGTDGTLRSMGVFAETALVHGPKTIDFLAASTLSCTWSTAWNILYGLQGREIKEGDWVLVQGTAGVSIATLQLAIASGANVVATSSNEEKAARVRALGAVDTVNYRTNPKWGEDARALTPNGRGFDFVVDVGGAESLPQSLQTVRVDGLLMVIGAVGDASASQPSLLSVMMHTCIARGILGGSRRHLQDVAHYIDEHGIKPAVDDVVFQLEEAKDAYRRMKKREHFSKVVININYP